MATKLTPDACLVVGPAWVGDMVMAQSLFMTLRESNPDMAIDVVAPGWSLPLLARMPQIRDAIELPVGHGRFAWGVRRRIGISLRGHRYEQAIVLPRSFKSALIPFHARATRRTGYRGEMRYGLLNDIRQMDSDLLTRMVERIVALGRSADDVQPPPIPQPKLRVDHDNRRRLVETLSLDIDMPVIAMMPGAEYGAAKCWPLEYYGQLARELADSGYSVWLLGSRSDRASGQTIVEASRGAAINLCGQTQLEDTIDLLSIARRAVTNDSGLMHIAAAVGCHVVAIFGSSNPEYTPPLTDRCSVHYLGLDCSPCMARECPLGHFRCMKDLTPDRIIGDVVQSTD
jgi:heptosyltransferase-2